MTERRLFQIVLTLAACVPVFGGLHGLLQGIAGASLSDDSHYRYLSGLLLGIGLAFWSCVRTPENHTARFRLLTFIVLTGGLARLVYALAAGFDNTIAFTLVMELGVTPLMAYWQSRVIRAILYA